MRANIVYIEDFSHAAIRQVKTLRHNRRLRALDPQWNKPYICLINGEPQLRAGWNRRIRHGDVVAFINLPPQVRGGGGGSSPLKVVMMVALAVAAPGIGNVLANTAGLAGFGFNAATPFLGINAGTLIGGAFSLVGDALITSNKVKP